MHQGTPNSKQALDDPELPASFQPFLELLLSSHNPQQLGRTQEPKELSACTQRKRREGKKKHEPKNPTLPFSLQVQHLLPNLSLASPEEKKRKERKKRRSLPRKPLPCSLNRQLKLLDTTQSVIRDRPCILHKTHACTHLTMSLQVLNTGLLVSNIRRATCCV